MKSICVYCGSSPGFSKEYSEAAKKLGENLAERGFRLIYGGGRAGLMGTVAQAVLDSGGEVTGVIPEELAKGEVAYSRCTELEVVSSMHVRKARMEELSDGFIALPGGLGTFEELLEILTWGQLGFHKKPCGVLNIQGYFDLLLQFLDHSVNEGFVKSNYRNILLNSSDSGTLLDLFKSYKAPQSSKIKDSLKHTSSRK